MLKLVDIINVGIIIIIKLIEYLVVLVLIFVFGYYRFIVNFFYLDMVVLIDGL